MWYQHHFYILDINDDLLVPYRYLKTNIFEF
jgi:hypothetical protein